MKNKFPSLITRCSLLIALLLLVAGCSPDPAPPAEQAAPDEVEEAEEVELAAYMSDLQRWTHKLLLGVEAENRAVSEFYLHELEEQVEAITAEVPTYEGYPISDLVEAMLVPQIEALHAAVESGDWAAIRTRLDAVIQSCNQCHAATDHGFIQISADPLPNPYIQDFSPTQ